MKLQYTLKINADSRPGLLHLISGIIEKKLIRIISFCLKSPQGDGSVMMVVEILIRTAELENLCLKLKNIIEVYSVEVSHPIDLPVKSEYMQ